MMRRPRAGVFSTALLLAFLGTTTLALENGLARTPVMGWSTWNAFLCEVDQEKVVDVAHAMLANGVLDAGYKYINIDDCWEAPSRDEQGRLVGHPTRFSLGMAALSDNLHSMGFKFGIYSSAGVKTCQKFPASLGNEVVDAQTFADWGVDYLKYDNCNNLYLKPEARYPVMRDALMMTGRPVVYGLCEWGANNPGAWAKDVANSYRISQDIQKQWSVILRNTDINSMRWRYAGPGHFNDPDSLEIGNAHLTREEEISHMSLWSIMKAPLILGCDMRKIDPGTVAIFTNKDMIAINQDPLGVQARRLWSDTMDPAHPPAIVVPCPASMEEVAAYDGVWGKQEPQPWVYEASTKRVTDHHGRCLTAPTMKDNEALIFSACAPHDPTQMWFYDGTTFTLAATEGQYFEHPLTIGWCQNARLTVPNGYCQLVVSTAGLLIFCGCLPMLGACLWLTIWVMRVWCSSMAAMGGPKWEVYQTRTMRRFARLSQASGFSTLMAGLIWSSIQFQLCATNAFNHDLSAFCEAGSSWYLAVSGGAILFLTGTLILRLFRIPQVGKGKKMKQGGSKQDEQGLDEATDDDEDDQDSDQTCTRSLQQRLWSGRLMELPRWNMGGVAATGLIKESLQDEENFMSPKQHQR